MPSEEFLSSKELPTSVEQLVIADSGIRHGAARRLLRTPLTNQHTFTTKQHHRNQPARHNTALKLAAALTGR
jgi:hypothetical protein